MTKTEYQANVGKASKTARALMTNANVSIKYSTEICNQIKGKYVEDVIIWLEKIIAHEDYLPLKRYNKKVAHRKGEAKNGVKSGRYPQKTIRVFIDLLNSVKNNADFKGLDVERINIIHAFASMGVSRTTYQSKGKISGKARKRKSTHVEVIVSEVKK
jgi:large subunit ribosomal protein L22